MYVVTGAAGFIGSHIVKGLNERGVREILAVDDLTRGSKFENLSDCLLADYMDKREFHEKMTQGVLGMRPKVILHQGACTDTMEGDGRYMMENNFTFSRTLLEYALLHHVPFVYASSGAVYGRSRSNAVGTENERPINVYGFSKLVFDEYVRTRLKSATTTVAGLRYFNVYGPRETHKGRMASMVYQLYRQLKETGEARLFQGTDGYGDGEQRRDFVYVEDLVKVNLFYARDPGFKGIVNVGTGRSRTFNDVANSLIKLLGRGKVVYIPFNPELKGKYQSFTEAVLDELRDSGYSDEFTALEEGIEATVACWESPNGC
jgi:ADP-L-glycero-D-manno-heptose 6-epimerase